MLTYEECLDMSDITQDEVSAIAEHEHADPMIALAIGQYLCCHEGESKIQKIILDVRPLNDPTVYQPQYHAIIIDAFAGT